MVARCEDAVADAQMKANDIVVPLEGVDGTSMTVSSPFFIGGQAKRVAQRAPSVGEHTDELLREIGLHDAELQRLREAGVAS